MREKLADYLLDISKLIFAGVVLKISLTLEDFSNYGIFLFGILATALFFITAMILTWSIKNERV